MIRTPIEIINNDFAEYLDVAYSISNVCNYKCWYCGPELNSGSDRFPNDFETLTKNLDYILDIYRTKFNKKKIRINLMGGEPTLWRDIERFARHYHEQGCRINMPTNASRTLRWFKENGKYFDDIHVSVHYQFCNPDHLIEVLDYLYNETDVLGNSSILMDLENWDKCQEIADKMIAHPTPWVFKVKPIFHNTNMLAYSTEQLAYLRQKVQKRPPEEYIEKQRSLGRIPNKAPDVHVRYDDGSIGDYKTFDFFENDSYHFSGWKCNTIVDRLGINTKQQIVAFCGQKNAFNTTEPLNLLDKDFKSKFSSDMINPIICNQPSCTCPSDVRLSKIKFYDR